MKKTEIIAIVDKSGSMAGYELDTIGGVNSFIRKQDKINENLTITVVLFNEFYEIIKKNVNAKNAMLNSDNYQVGGTTALLDAIGNSILDTGIRNSKYKEKSDVYFVIMTDGLENSSKEFTALQIKKLINKQKELHDWKFIFLGASLESVKEAESFGISNEDAILYSKCEESYLDVFEKASEKINGKM
ncbi:vWA domain-containing protein [Clostridiaceae bacterium HSG29]|nr:vWA domain-containing protein [Clostridiaceae bacterium HSG29]